MLKVKNPVFIIGNYRGGTSILFRLLSESTELWSMYRESNHVWKKYHENKNDHAETFVLTEQDAVNEVKELDSANPEKGFKKLRAFFENHYNYSSYNNYLFGYLSRIRSFRDILTPLYDLMNIVNYFFKSLITKDYRIIDKTPPNCFRVSFLAKVFPDAKFIFLTRDPKTNTSSLMNAWRDKNRFKFRFRKEISEKHGLNIKNYDDDVWKFAMPPGWEAYLNKSLAEVCAFQAISAYEYALNDLEKLGSKKFIQIKFEDLLSKPDETIQKICNFTEIDYSPKMKAITKRMPLVNTASKPSKDKEDKNEIELQEVLEKLAPIQEKLGYIEEAN